MHPFYPVLIASTIGWLPSPFQYEVAIANLGLGVVAILSFNASYSFRLATVIVNTFWLWGVAVGHLYQVFAYHNYTVSNTGSWLWMDILIPLVLIICLRRLKAVR